MRGGDIIFLHANCITMNIELQSGDLMHVEKRVDATAGIKLAFSE